MNEIIVVVRPEVYNIMLLEYAHAMYYSMFLKKGINYILTDIALTSYLVLNEKIAFSCLLPC